MIKPSEHILGEKLSELLDGMLPESERRSVEAHLADCADCRRERDALACVVESLAALPTERVGDGFRRGVMERIDAAPVGSTERVIPLRRYMVRALPIAATLLVAVSLGLTFLGGPESPKSGQDDLRARNSKDRLSTDHGSPRELAGGPDKRNDLPDGVATDAKSDPVGYAARSAKPTVSTPAAAVMDKALAACASEAFGGVHQTLTMEAEAPDALAQRAVAVAAGLGVNATIVPMAKKLEGGGGDIRVRLTVPRAQYQALLKQLAGLTPVERRQVLENAADSEDKLLARAPAEFSRMRKAKRDIGARGGAMAMRAPGAPVVADAMQYEPRDAAIERESADVDGGRDARAGPERPRGSR